ncbi:galactose-3-O-sulfotransferase 2-like isoform X2 [Polypterus senegalus]|uniref:galactose-3-O-sulfotransferase 2-like isoform X2 n=1 Tax=Polypterus senegalus TaxID=55291 RepID=UPI0019645A5E|nr:galactose-3-O-sulfotransferase 2-like isoform X2 [Polypterus senegalus]
MKENVHLWRSTQSVAMCLKTPLSRCLWHLWMIAIAVTVLWVALQIVGITQHSWVAKPFNTRKSADYKKISEKENNENVKHDFNQPLARNQNVYKQKTFLDYPQQTTNPQNAEKSTNVLIKKAVSLSVEKNDFVGRSGIGQSHSASGATGGRDFHCLPKTHIVFLKTHKTASSTLLNILYRFGDTRNLTFALPYDQNNQLVYPLYFTASFVKGFTSNTTTKYDIICNHMRFHLPEVKRITPSDSFYFSILRNPVTMMESTFSYYKQIPAFYSAETLDEFLQDPQKYYNESLQENSYARNLLTFDFGFNNNDENNETRINKTIAFIERTFDLILISEYFDESMILLKNALCWSLDDVVSFKLNSRNNKTKTKVSLQTEQKIKEWNSWDWKLYLYFNSTFWRTIDKTVGRKKMNKEVKELRSKRNRLMKMCLKERNSVDPSKIKDESLKPLQYGNSVIQGYNLNLHLDNMTKQWCQKLITPELQYTKLLYDKLFPNQIKKSTPLNRKENWKTYSKKWRGFRSFERQNRNPDSPRSSQ